MTLENLLAIRRLVRHESEAGAILKLLAAAERNLADAKVTAITSETRFDAAYKAILQCAMEQRISYIHQRTGPSPDRHSGAAADAAA